MMPDATVTSSSRDSQFGPSGRLRAADCSSSDCTYVLWMHLSSLIGAVVLGPLAVLVPLFMWISRRDQPNGFVDDHGREVMNLWITGGGLFVIGMFTGIGMLAWLIWAVVQAIAIVRASIAANEGEYFRYPMLVRLLG